MARRQREPSAAVEEWSRRRVEVAPEPLRCRERAWFWRSWNTWAGVASFPSDVFCVRHRDHDGRHSTRPRRSWLWHPGAWHALRW